MNKLISVILLIAVMFTQSIATVSAVDDGKPTLYIAGDSTAQTYKYSSYYPQTGWGQVFADYFTDDIHVDNRALGGRSARRFDEEGSLNKILELLKPGDFFLIQFGINDGDIRSEIKYTPIDEYKRILKERYIAEAEKRNATPVLMTPSAGGNMDQTNTYFKETRKEYADATRELAQELGCKFIDINRIMTDTYNSMDKAEVLAGYMICEPLESVVDPIGCKDLSHFKENGARRVAKLIIDNIPQCVPELSKYLRNTEYFSDISGHKYEQDIKNALLKGLLLVNVDARFKPDDKITRAEFLKLVMDAAKINGHARRNEECLGLTNNDWYCYYVQGALDKALIPLEMTKCVFESKVKTVKESNDDKADETVNIISYSCGFKGNNFITREEMAAIAENCFAYSAAHLNKDISLVYSEDYMTDNTINPAYLSMVKKAFAYGILDGFDNDDFRPKDNATRAEAVSVINRIADKLW